MRPISIRHRLIASVLLFAPTMTLAGQAPPSRFTLGNYVPENAWFYIHTATNPERAWLDQKWAEIFADFKKSGIDKDVMNLVMSAMSESDRTQAQATVDKITALINGVNWSDLAKHEFVFAERMVPGQTGYGYLLMVRGAEGSATANVNGLVAILKAVVDFAPMVKLNESKAGDVDVWTLFIGGGKPGDLAVPIDLFRKGDVIGLAMDVPFGNEPAANRATVQEVLDLMTAKPTKTSVIASKRYQEAVALVPAPQDAISFFDVKAFLGDLGKMFERFAQLAAKEKPAEPKVADAKDGDTKNGESKETSGPEEAAQALGLARKLITLLDFMDYSVTSFETKGRRELKHEAVRFQPGKETGPMVSACILRKPFEKFDQFIPADATGFSLSGGADLGAIYNLAMDFIGSNVPDGKNIVAQIQGALAGVGFDPQRDLFDWLSGEMISVDMPAAVVTPMGGSDSVTMIRVKNPQVAAQKVNAAIDFLSAQMQASGQMLMITPAKVSAEGFREVTHPAIAMFARPVIGVSGDWLMIGSSAGAVGKCLDVSSGKIASIKENARYKAEGLVPTGPVLAASFKDTSNFGTELSGIVGMAGMFGGMALGNIPEKDADSKQFKKVAQSALGLLMKLGPILQKIDFYSSESSVKTYDGKLTTKTESVVTYKPDKPAPAAAPTAPATPEPPKAPAAPKP